MHKSSVKLGSVVFELRERTDRRTDKHTYLSQYFEHLMGGEEKDEK